MGFRNVDCHATNAALECFEAFLLRLARLQHEAVYVLLHNGQVDDVLAEPPVAEVGADLLTGLREGEKGYRGGRRGRVCIVAVKPATFAAGEQRPGSERARHMLQSEFVDAVLELPREVDEAKDDAGVCCSVLTLALRRARAQLLGSVGCGRLRFGALGILSDVAEA